MFRARRALALAGVSGLILTLGAACGSEDDGGDGDGGSDGGNSAGGSAPWILGTTESVTAMDPAGSYDFGSWNVQYNVFEQLLTIPAGAAEPVGDAAESCAYDDPQTITCTLREGLTFSNGNELTSSDVLFSLKRNIEIADPNGSSVLLYNISDGAEENPTLAEGAVETPDDLTVVFHLNAADTTFLKLLSTATTSIVDEETFPADSLMADDAIIGSGPYKLSQYKPGEQAVFEANRELRRPPDAGGRRRSSCSTSPTRPRSRPPSRPVRSTSRGALSARPTSTTSKQGGEVEVIRGEGSEFRYWVWQLENERAEGEGGPPGGRPDHRPRRDHGQRLRRHDRAVVLDRAPGLRWPEELVRGEVRRPGRRTRPRRSSRRPA